MIVILQVTQSHVSGIFLTALHILIKVLIYLILRTILQPIILPISQMWILRHLASKGQSQDLNPGSLAPEFVLLTTTSHATLFDSWGNGTRWDLVMCSQSQG